MKKFTILALILAVGATSQATLFGFSVPIIDGTQEVVPHVTNAYGTSSFVVDDTNYSISGSVNLWNFPMTSITGLHLHEGAVGVAGPVKFNIMSNMVGSFSAGNMLVIGFAGTTTAAFLSDLISGDAYINVHNSAYPAGLIRGQVVCVESVPEPASIAALAVGAVALVRRRRK